MPRRAPSTPDEREAAIARLAARRHPNRCGIFLNISAADVRREVLRARDRAAKVNP